MSSSRAVPTVILEPNPNDRETRAEPTRALVVPCPEGGALVDVCDAHVAPVSFVPFSCKSANCGTCRIDVLEGLSELLPAADDERAVLDLFAAPPEQRLACQAQMKPGVGVLRIRAVRDDS
jgi:2Fe-2S ferredoxin